MANLNPKGIDWTDLAVLIADNISLREIARLKNCSHSSVRKAINRFNLIYIPDKSLIGKMQYDNGKCTGLLNVPNPALKIKYACEICNKESEQYISKYNTYEHHFCSLKCRAKFTGLQLKNSLEYKELQRQLSKRLKYKPPLKIGEDHWNWKGGISKIDRGSDYKYIQWRKDIFLKFNFTCQKCGIRGGKLSAHHVREWSKFPELRYDLDNGLCLCYDCHMELHGLNKKKWPA